MSSRITAAPDRSRGRSRRWRFLAVAVLAALAVTLAWAAGDRATPAHAQSTDPIWSATLTVADIGFGESSIGFNSNGGALTPNTFSLGGASFTVNALGYDYPSNVYSLSRLFTWTGSPTFASAYALCFDDVLGFTGSGTELFGTSGVPTSNSATNPGWSVGDVVAVKLWEGSACGGDTLEPGVTVTPSSVRMARDGGTASFTVVLNTEPSSDVTLNLSSSDRSIVTINDATGQVRTVTFTSSNWDRPRKVTLSAVDNGVANPNGQRVTTIQMAVNSLDNDYFQNTSVDLVTVTVTDVPDPETCDVVAPIANGDVVTGRWDVCRYSYFTFDTDRSMHSVEITLSAVDARGYEVAVDLILREGSLGASGTEVDSSLRFGPLPSGLRSLTGQAAPTVNAVRSDPAARINRHDLTATLGARGYVSYSYEARISQSHQPRRELIQPGTVRVTDDTVEVIRETVYAPSIVYPVTFTLTHRSSHSGNSSRDEAQRAQGQESPGEPQLVGESEPSLTDPGASPPTADAGADFNIKRGEVVTLRGSGAANAEGSQALSYRWTVSGASHTELVTVGANFLSDATQAEAGFTMMRRKHMSDRSALDNGNSIEFTLTVTDGDGESHSDTVTVTIQGTTWTP